MSIDYLTSNSFTARHGFFGRAGGVSTGLYAGLNCAQMSGDDSETVQANRDRVALEMGVSAGNLLSLHQIHSNKVVEVTQNSWPEGQPDADAMVSGERGVGLGIITADCVPVLFCDPNANIIGAAHAGWQGALTGIIDATINAMLKLGAKRANLQACIGPCISQKNYEVGQEFLENFIATDPNHAEFFINGDAGKYFFDLPRFVITSLNVQKIQSVDWINKCTYDSENDYFSYRRATHRQEADYGRQISVITNSVD